MRRRASSGWACTSKPQMRARPDGRLHQAGEDFERGRLAGGVGAEHGEKFAARDGEREVADRDQLAEFFGDAGEFDHGRLHSSIVAVRFSGSSTRRISPSVLT